MFWMLYIEVDEIYMEKIKPNGTGARIASKKEWIGRKAIVIIPKGELKCTIGTSK